MGIRKTNVNLHGVTLYITVNHLGFFFAKFVEVADVSSLQLKASIATGGFDIKGTLTRKKDFMEIPNVMTFVVHLIYSVLEGWCPLCRSCVASENLRNVFLE